MGRGRGPGIPAGAGGSIFERFVRAPQQPQQSGMGLGLSIVKSIVEEHGGRVEARNVAPAEPDSRSHCRRARPRPLCAPPRRSR